VLGETLMKNDDLHPPKGEASAPRRRAGRKARARARRPRPAQFAVALGNPLRAHILAQVDGHACSPEEVASRRDEPVAKIAYHFQVLQRCGYIEPVAESLENPPAALLYRKAERKAG
jgi:hypothetical protein